MQNSDNVVLNRESVACDLCGSVDASHLFLGRDYRFARKEEYRFVQCHGCGLTYLSPRPTQEAMMRLYEEDYLGGEPEVTWEAASVPAWKAALKTIWHKVDGQLHEEVLQKVHGRVLDIGCGAGNLMDLLKRSGCDVYGIEPNPNSVMICNGRGVKKISSSLEAADFPNGLFDYVVMSHVIEHLPSPKRTLTEVRRILRPRGQVLIFCPNADSYLRRLFGKYWHGWHIPFHFHVFSRHTLARLAEEAGFIVASVRAVTPGSCFWTSSKSYLYGDSECGRPIDRGPWLDKLIFRVPVALVLRLLDGVFGLHADCLDAELTKP